MNFGDGGGELKYRRLKWHGLENSLFPALSPFWTTSNTLWTTSIPHTSLPSQTLSHKKPRALKTSSNLSFIISSSLPVQLSILQKSKSITSFDPPWKNIIIVCPSWFPWDMWACSFSATSLLWPLCSIWPECALCSCSWSECFFASTGSVAFAAFCLDTSMSWRDSFWFRGTSCGGCSPTIAKIAFSTRFSSRVWKNKTIYGLEATEFTISEFDDAIVTRTHILSSNFILTWKREFTAKNYELENDENGTSESWTGWHKGQCVHLVSGIKRTSVALTDSKIAWGATRENGKWPSSAEKIILETRDKRSICVVV